MSLDQSRGEDIRLDCLAGNTTVRRPALAPSPDSHRPSRFSNHINGHRSCDRVRIQDTANTSPCVYYVSFWVVPRRLNYICRRFGTLYLFHLHRQVVWSVLLLSFWQHLCLVCFGLVCFGLVYLFIHWSTHVTLDTSVTDYNLHITAQLIIYVLPHNTV